MSGDPVLDAPRRATLEAVLETMFPADENGPGATDLGVPGYVEAGLAGNLVAFAEIYRDGLDELDRLALEREGTTFAVLNAARRTSVLELFDADPKATSTSQAAGSGRAFVDVLHEHLYEGVLGDPVHGANADGGGWRLVGYPGPRPTITAAEQDLGVAGKGLTSTYDEPMYAPPEGP